MAVTTLPSPSVNPLLSHSFSCSARTRPGFAAFGSIGIEDFNIPASFRHFSHILDIERDFSGLLFGIWHQSRPNSSRKTPNLPQSPQISSVWNCVFFAFLICWPGLRDNLSGKISGKISRKIYPAKFLGAFRTSLDRDWIGNDIDRDFSGLLFAHPGHRKRKTSKSVSFSHRSKPLQNGH